jgi:hypothetical protein
MQANKADQGVMRDLQKWLEDPSVSAGSGMDRQAKEDLAWLRSTNDLSSVNLNGAPKKAPSRKSEDIGGGPAPGGFASLFSSCAGRRK